MTADQYLYNILAREAVDVSATSPVRGIQANITPLLQAWAGPHLRGIVPSGSFAKGTANRSGTDIDLFISLTETATASLGDIYNSLFETLRIAGAAPKKQNVSINIRLNGYDVDLVPARQQNMLSEDHSLFRRRANTWTKTNVATHIAYVMYGECIPEIRILKLWRNQKGLDFPSFYLELVVIAALRGVSGTLAQRVFKALTYIRGNLLTARIVDPSNTNNVISDDLTAVEKASLVAAARIALGAKNWSEIVQ
jgi:hypothetical protein